MNSTSNFDPARYAGIRHLGVTGTRYTLPPEQSLALDRILEALDHSASGVTLHHGDCTGADEAAHNIWRCKQRAVIIHPGPDSNNRAYAYLNETPETAPNMTVLPEKPYLDRNHDIVDECELLIALPSEFKERIRSGTWATVRYARTLVRPILVIYPDGTHEEFNPYRFAQDVQPEAPSL